ncbi:integrase catalytic domain-containing protein [Trichonephila clavipes]|nr:integrase catalytic domain-containing protein [Trichonephila clavipes]
MMDLMNCPGLSDQLVEIPLTYASEDPGELISLTPLQCFLERVVLSVSDIEELNSRKLLKRVKYRRKVFNDLRQRFRREYLSELIQKSNEKSSHEPKVGEIVLIGDDIKKTFWPMAKIIELNPGQDGKIRSVKLKIQHGTVLRSVQRVYPLEIRANENCVTKEVVGERESNSKKGVNAMTAPNDVIQKYTSSGGCTKTPNRLDLFNYHCHRFDTLPEYQTSGCCENSRALNGAGVE